METKGWCCTRCSRNWSKFKAIFTKDRPVPTGASDPYVPSVKGAASPSINIPAPPPND